MVMTLAIVAGSCAASASGAPAGWQSEMPTGLEDSPFRAEVTAHVAASLTADPLVSASCIDQVATTVTDVSFTDLGVNGMRNFGVTADDPSVVGTDVFFASLPATTRGRVVAAIADCGGLALQLSVDIPGVSYASLACLVDRLSASGFFEMGDANGAATATFASAKTDCLSVEEMVACDDWSARQLAAPDPVVLSPIDCKSIDAAPFAAALGFDIDKFEPSVIKTDAERPVGCAYGDPDEAGPWVMLYAATQKSQLELYESPIPQVAATWADLSEILEYAGVLFIAEGGSVEWLDDAVTAIFDDGNTSAAVTAGDYLLMVSAGPGGEGPQLSRTHLAGAVEALAVALALS